MSFIEKEVEWLRSFLPTILKHGYLIENYTDEQANSLKVFDIDVKMIAAEEAFMLTQCYRGNISFEYAGTQYNKKMVVKKTPDVPMETYDSIDFGSLFSNEINFYTKILPAVQEMADGKFAATKYYYSEIRDGYALLILEDFAENGWRMTKNRSGLDLEHARKAVKYLGKFHGFGLALKQTNNKAFTQLTAELKESRYGKDTVHSEWELELKTSLTRTMKATRQYQPQISEGFITKWQKLVGNYLLYGRQRVAPREPLATLCHGDFLRNNVAYKYAVGATEGTPLDVMMFDYQTLRYSSPMIDLTVFLALSLYADVRYKNFDLLFDDYCEALADGYSSHTKEQVPDYLRRDNLIKEYIRWLPYSTTITAFFLLSLVEPPTITAEEMFNMVRTDEEIIARTMTCGGEIVDREIAHQVKEMYDLSQLHHVEIDEGIIVNY